MASRTPRSFEFNFNQTFEVYLPPGKSFRVSVGGWEGDYIEVQFGKILNPYSTCSDARRFVEKEFDGSDFVNHGRLDDTVRETTRVFTFDAVANGRHSVESKGEITNFPGEKTNDPNKNFRTNFTVRVSSAKALKSRPRAFNPGGEIPWSDESFLTIQGINKRVER